MKSEADRSWHIEVETFRHSYDKASGKSAIHMVSAWETSNHFSLRQVVVHQKSKKYIGHPAARDPRGARLSGDRSKRWAARSRTSEKIVKAKAQILLKADADGPAWPDAKIAEAFDCRVQTVESLRKRVSVGRHEGL